MGVKQDDSNNNVVKVRVKSRPFKVLGEADEIYIFSIKSGSAVEVRE